MSLQSLYGPNGLSQTPPSIVPLSIKDNGSAREGLPFTDLLKGIVEETDKQQQVADTGVKQLVTGEAESIHEVVLTTARADLAFRLMMEIRNRLIASYQEVMRMQI
ncbi:MAG: flagellar hook-basal body complex protein FliE [Planctomycetota bacterium]|nr:MAG: flagellar hook-basal body complex protein FliE [Planctomycetota bacterium]